MMDTKYSLLDDMETVKRLDYNSSARAVLNFRLAGGTKILIDYLIQQYKDMLDHVRLVSTFMAPPSEFSLSTFLHLLKVCDACCRNYDFSHDFATFGGHMLLKKISTSDLTPSDIIDAVGNVIGSITLSGCIFPFRGMVVTDRFVESTVRPAVCEFVKVRESEGATSELDDESYYKIFRVHLRSIPISMYGTGQHAVGYLLWSSAVILSRFLVQNEEELIRHKTVLECGAGLGLCGIVAGRFASKVTLSDFNETLVENLQYNIQINQGLELLDGYQSAIAEDCIMDVCIIDWNIMDAQILNGISLNNVIAEPGGSHDDEGRSATDSTSEVGENVKKESLEENPEINANCDIKDICNEQEIMIDKSKIYDVIIGSDLVYCQGDTVGILKVISTFLSEKGIFIIVLPKPCHRYGTEFLVPTLQNNGFEVYSRCVAYSKCTSSEVLPYNDSTFKKCWRSAGIDHGQHSKKDDDSFDGIHEKIYSLLDKLCVDDDYLVSELDEHPFVAWDMIIGHRR